MIEAYVRLVLDALGVRSLAAYAARAWQGQNRQAGRSRPGADPFGGAAHGSGMNMLAWVLIGLFAAGALPLLAVTANDPEVMTPAYWLTLGWGALLYAFWKI